MIVREGPDIDRLSLDIRMGGMTSGLAAGLNFRWVF